ncbi:MAG: hypothetical protein IPJ41_13155 [Phycisphaerales bacterium]|nr:hypothetical protein [Phycisphaerales bacterium]
MDLDAASQSATIARLDEAAGSYVLLNATRSPAGGRISIGVFENGQFMGGDYRNLGFSFEHIRVEGAWMGEELSLRVTNRDTLASGSVGITVASSIAGGDAGLAVARDRPDIYEFGATFDNFWICPADVDTDGVLDTRDFLAFLNAWVQQRPLADWDGSGGINTQDFLAFLNQWAVGC